MTPFPEPREQARAIGAFSFVGAGGASIGLVLGGLLTEAVGWHWIFLVNVPIGALAMLPAVRVIDADRGIGFQVMIILYLQGVLGYGAAASGLGLLPTAAVIGTVALGLSARIAARFGPRAMLLAGLGLITAGLALLTLVPVQASYPTQIFPPLLIFGAGGGLCLPALASLGMSGATPADAGLASGYHLAFAVGAGLAGVALVVATAVLRPSRRRAALAECC